MKSILISIKPEWVAKILNGEKTIEVRKTAPKCDLPIDVYIYCTKNKLHYSVGALMFNKDDCFKRSVDGTYKYGDSVELMGYSPDYPYGKNNFLNGKVVAKFTLKTIGSLSQDSFVRMEGGNGNYILKDACLSLGEIKGYAKGNDVYLWHISDLVIFDKPKELSEFMPPKWDKCGVKDKNGLYQCDKCPYGDWVNVQCKRKPLTKAPQSWCYVEERYLGATMRKTELPKEVGAKPYKKGKR